MRLAYIVVAGSLLVLGAGAGFLAHSIRSGVGEQSTAVSGAGAQVLAHVDGTPITLQELALADEEMAAQLGQVPESTRLQYLLSMLIDRRIMALAAKKSGYESDPQARQRNDYYKEKVLRDVYWLHAMAKEITPEAVKAYYDAHYADLPPEQEIHARHILVQTKEDADKALASIKKGEAFEDVAKAVSKDEAASQGGDLGWFKKSDMLPEFSDAAFKLEPGEMSGPVKTSVGWHVIKVIESREATPKTLEQAQTEIVQTLTRDRGRKLIENMRKSAKIEIAGSDQPSAEGEPAMDSHEDHADHDHDDQDHEGVPAEPEDTAPETEKAE